jgi:hypothetical protein
LPLKWDEKGIIDANGKIITVPPIPSNGDERLEFAYLMAKLAFTPAKHQSLVGVMNTTPHLGNTTVIYYCSNFGDHISGSNCEMSVHSPPSQESSVRDFLSQEQYQPPQESIYLNKYSCKKAKALYDSWCDKFTDSKDFHLLTYVGFKTTLDQTYHGSRDPLCFDIWDFITAHNLYQHSDNLLSKKVTYVLAGTTRQTR